MSDVPQNRSPVASISEAESASIPKLNLNCYNQIMKISNPFKAIVVLLVLVVIVGLVALLRMKKQGPALVESEVSEARETASAVPVVSPRVSMVPENSVPVFDPDLKNKKPGTKSYYSEKLGVGFTYSPYPEGATTVNQSILVTEKGNKIFVHAVDQKPEDGQWLEVFTTNAPSLTAAIQEKLLKGINPKDCFSKVYSGEGANGFGPATKLPGNVFAGISYPAPSDPTAPFWDNSKKCTSYSETNGLQYFQMSEKVPTKFIFLSIGQYVITDDGTANSSWANSVTIVK